MQNASALFGMLFLQTLIFHHAFYGVFYIPQRDAFVFKISLVHILVVDYIAAVEQDVLSVIVEQVVLFVKITSGVNYPFVFREEFKKHQWCVGISPIAQQNVFIIA